eukprot:CAMPEP_0183710196 /NCGR_PEP_ID=MMETSP0737-20130205/5998_1 /TAXON_ID=385413 /ORGANISM="Thalassiosira miniscula, Strain CCMP1093" /LENGTH=490 /DNA_ID=CAMNT_0025938421 /DNA_START=68 /DNA_END=1540 /DNA_ORIENTATION=+
MTTGARDIGPGPGRTVRPMHKWILAICWLFVMAQIWGAPDVDDYLPESEREENAAIQIRQDPDHPDYIPPNYIPPELPLLEALQPITYKSCCMPPGIWRETSDMACFGTCYNERACIDPLYPYSSEEEKAMLPINDSVERRKELIGKCKSPKNIQPPMEWCQKTHHSHATNNITSSYLVNGIPPAGCSLTSGGGGSGAFQHVILFPSAKLAFCGIPKVGITQWEQFLRFTLGAKDYPSLPHAKLDREVFQFDKLAPEAQRRIWEDEEWTWAAFVRNPAERLLSAYLDKVKGQAKNQKWLDGIETFEDFVNSLSKTFNETSCAAGGAITGLSWCSDPHWRPQVYSCGMSERIDRFQFIGDIHNAADQTRELLDHVGLWESHGKYFIHGGRNMGSNPWCHYASHPYNHTTTRHLGFQQKDEVKNASAAKVAYKHATGSKSKLEEYYTPELLEKVHEFYADDFKLWKLVGANGDRLSRGKDLAHGLSSQCPKS